VSAPVDVLADLARISNGEGDIELAAMRVKGAVAELMKAADSHLRAPLGLRNGKVSLRFMRSEERLIAALKACGAKP
jgi:hypothetical protein